MKKTQLDLFESFTNQGMINPTANSYREKFGLSLPGAGARVRLKRMPGVDYYIQWVDCNDGEDILYGWEKSKEKLERIIVDNNWSLIE